MSKPTESEPGHEGLSVATALRNCLVSGVVCLGPDLAQATLNREAAQILHLDPAQPQVSATVLPGPLQGLAREVLAADQAMAERDVPITVPEGGALSLRVSGFPVQSAGKHCGVVLVLNDLGPARQLASHLAQLDRLASAGTLAASMAHEIKNALVAGKTFIDLLLEQKQDGELVDIVRRELGRIDAIVTRMLKFAGPARHAMGPVSLHEVLDHSLRLVQHRVETTHLSLQRAFRASPDIVQGDDYELEQACVNLFLNALDAMGPSGTLTVATETLSPDGAAALVPKAPRRAYVCLTIQDTGIGIRPESLARLFEPFFTTKAAGTGLGLPITQRIIQEHHGVITVDSQPGKGTTFRILLPTV